MNKDKDIINLCVRIERELRNELKIIAIQQNRELKELLLELLTDYVEKNKK